MPDARTVFLTALQQGDAAEVERLLAHDAALAEVRTDAGVSARLWALYHGHAALAEALTPDDDALDLFEATALGRRDRVLHLLEGDPEAARAQSPDGFSALGLAAFFGRAPLLTLLLAHGAQADAPSQNAMQVRPLHSAAAHRDPDVALAMARRLLKHGADPNAQQQGGWTPLHQAAAHGHEPLARLLLEHGAHPATRSDDDRTPADMARAGGYDDLARLLDE